MKEFHQLTAASESEPTKNDDNESSRGFYEEIEAPKFVDFTLPDHYRPDDRYWFCLRVGCDQKHEEELDLEEINKNFVLRVMAARSPNIKIRKMLNRKQNCSTLRCPLTAPAKPSKSRISRLAIASSLSRKLIGSKEKSKPLSKLGSTPIANLKRSSSKTARAFTTPRNRKRVSSNADRFRSVRNPKPMRAQRVAEPKNNKVVAKALVFNSPKKVARAKTTLELKTPVGKLCEAMSKLEIATGKKQRPLETTKTPVGKLCAAMLKPEIASGKKEALPLDKTARKQFRGREIKSRVFDALNYNAKKDPEMKPLKSMKTKKIEKEYDSMSDLEVDQRPKQGSLDNARNGEANDHNEKVDSSAVKIGLSEDIGNDDKENALPSDQAENESVVIESDEKENTSASDGNRELKDDSEDNILITRDIKKVNQVTKKPLKKSCIVTHGGQEAKYTKPKPTNPKPFRLRTDERSILKEATLEKKLVTPLREVTSLVVVKPLGLKSSRKIPTPSQKIESVREQNENENENVTRQNCETKMNKTDSDEPRSSYKGRTSSGKSSEKTKSPKKLARPQGIGSSRKTFGVIKERPESKIVRHKESVVKASEKKSVSQGRMKHSGVPRSVSRGRITIPKEPNFHTIHVPKSCTKNLA